MSIYAQNLPIGVFDSGIGGLTIVRAINALLPAENIIFLADQANLPYGEKSEDEIMRLTQAAVPTLIAEGAKVVVIACNSASLAIIERLRERYPGTPFVGVVPAIKPAAEHTETGTIAVFATRTTLSSPLYQRLKSEHTDNVTVLDIPCPKWVPMIESGIISESAVRRPLEQALQAQADQLVLGCTHYPFLAEQLQPFVAGRAELLESGPAVAEQVKRILVANESLARGTRGTNRYLTSAYSKKSDDIASKLLGKPVEFRLVG